ncbi:hypothetical protein ACJ72_07091 [Emergomyces africanus]|uniref:FAD-binding domain-containing protein n=1 Tax=Emergomyces africanus TaxID=1955775 RepID=A0A1B7NP60_9EURO|nr:hypothetical protein ACJ72_07091 [Emergomyces africanus]
MALKPYADARSSLGDVPVDIDDAREQMWIGDGTYLMHNILNQGHLVQFIISVYEKGGETSDKWHRMVSAGEISKLYQDRPSHMKKAANEVSGPFCMIGDAAHATTPCQGSGCSMSFEDRLILSTLLGRSKSPGEALVALRVYDQVHRPRTQRIVESSRGHRTHHDWQRGEARAGAIAEVGFYYRFLTM